MRSALAMYASYLVRLPQGSSTAQLIPKDPFLDPERFLRAVSAFQDSRLCNSSSTTQPFLTDDILNVIDTAYSKSRTTEPYKVHRVLLNKLDDLTTDLRTSSGPTNFNPADIDQFIHFAETKAAKDGLHSLKYLWGGRADMLALKRKERLWSDGEDDGGRDREKTERMDELSTGDENERAWRGKRVQRKIESWAGWVHTHVLERIFHNIPPRLSRQKKRSEEAGMRSRRPAFQNDSSSWNRDSPLVPQVVVSRYNFAAKTIV